MGSLVDALLGIELEVAAEVVEDAAADIGQTTDTERGAECLHFAAGPGSPLELAPPRAIGRARPRVERIDVRGTGYAWARENDRHVAFPLLPIVANATGAGCCDGARWQAAAARQLQEA